MVQRTPGRPKTTRKAKTKATTSLSTKVAKPKTRKATKKAVKKTTKKVAPKRRPSVGRPRKVKARTATPFKQPKRKVTKKTTNTHKRFTLNENGGIAYKYAALVPCGHLCVCEDCCSSILPEDPTCGFCGEQVTAIVVNTIQP